MSKHLDKYTTFRYVSNQLTPEQETLVQEHISECAKCRDEIRKYRALSSGIGTEQSESPSIIKLIYKSTLFRVAASLIIVAGITFTIINTRPKTLPIQSGHDSGTILSTDTYQSDTTASESDTLHTAPAEYYYTPEK